MTIFFTIIGLGVSIKLVKKGGKLLFTYWILCGILAYCQNTIAIVFSKVTNLQPLLGLMCGTISMEGGHANAAVFGSTIEKLGAEGAVTVGLAAATVGLILGGIIGAPVSRYLIEKYNLKPNNKLHRPKTNILNSITKTSYKLTPIIFFEQALIILLCMNSGELVTNFIFKITNVVLPKVVGCMIVAAIFRNFNDKFKLMELDFNLLDFLSELCLGMFLTMALMNINLLDLVNIAGPMFIIIAAQIAFILFYAIFICFRLLGKDFDAAIIISGLIGHGIGATPNALANMSSVSQKYGYSEKAFLVVPLVGAFLLDLFTIPCIVLFINLFK